MAAESIHITIREDGARVVKRNIEEIGTAAKSADGSVSFLKRTLAGLATAAALIKGVQLADSFTNIQNRLRTVTSSTEEMKKVMESLYGVAQRSRQSFEGIVEVYARTAASAKNLGTSHQDLLEFTETLSKAVAMSGASASESTAALIQLSQGMSAGALRGDELRSVLEQLPTVADVIAKSLGVTRGQLRAMGKDGEITSEKILKAFQEAREEIAGKFALAVPTVGQAMTVLNNALGKLVGETDQAAGATTFLARTIISLSEHLPTIVKGLLAIGAGMIVAYGPTILGYLKSAVAAVRAFAVAIAANPIATLAVVIATVVTAIALFRDEIVLVTKDAITLGDYMRAVWEIISEGASFVAHILKGILIPAMTEVRSEAGYLGKEFSGVFDWLKKTINDVIAGFVGLGKTIAIIITSIPAILRGNLKADELGHEIQKAFISSIDVDYIGTVAEEGKYIIDSLTERARKFAQERHAMQKKDVDLTKRPPKLPGPVDEKAAKELAKFKKDLNALIDSVDPLIAGIRILTDAETLLDKAVKKGLISMEYKADIMDKVRQKHEEQLDPLAAVNRELEQQIKLLNMSADSRDVEASVMQFQEKIRGQGVVLMDSEVQKYREQFQAIDDLNKSNELKASILEDLHGSQKNLLVSEKALSELLGEGKISIQEYNRALIELKIQAGQASFSDGFIGQLEVMQKGMDDFTTRTAGQFATLTDGMIDGFADATARSIVFGDSFSENIGRAADQALAGLISGLIKVGIQMIINAALGKTLSASVAASNAAVAGSAAIAWAPAAALASLATVGTNAPAAMAGMTSTFALSQSLAAASLAGFRTGGEMIVGGTGGVDSQMVAFRATPGESVHINTPAQARAAEQTETNVNVPVRVVNVIDPRQALAAMNTSDGERIILNVIENNPAAIRRFING